MSVAIMKKIFFLIYFFIAIVPAARATEILAIKSYDIKPFNDALEGFKKGCTCTVKELLLDNINPSQIERKVNSFMPSGILAIGEKALTALKDIKDIPIIYTNVPFPWLVAPESQKNIAGVGMIVPPRKQLDLLLSIAPGIKRLGLVYDPDETGRLVKDIRIAAEELGLDILTLPTENPEEALSLIQSLAGKVDAYWMIPDVTVISSISLEVLKRFSLENNVPVLTFSKHFIEKGAFMALNIDDFDMGIEAGKIAKEILVGVKIKNIPDRFAGRILLNFNSQLAIKFGITPGKTNTIQAKKENK
jgi:putative ABC transport system substrate-binding protein